MNFSSKILEDSVNSLASLPGIGKKTALRLALHLVQGHLTKAERIAASLTNLATNIKTCSKCHNISDHQFCDICLSTNRDLTRLCIVESARDVMAIEETNQFRGFYHVLGGIISPLEGIGPDDLNMDTLIKRIDHDKVEEIILAISPTIEGETTMYYISKLLENKEVTISAIARGVSFGGDLEYADEQTLGRSIVSRLPYHAQL